MVETKLVEFGGPWEARTPDQWIKSLRGERSKFSGLLTPSLPNLPFFYGISRRAQTQR